MKSLSLVALLLLAACTGVPSNGRTEMCGGVTTGVETGRTMFRH